MTRGRGDNSAMIGGICIGGDPERVEKSLMILGRRGIKKGRPRKCYYK
jgi:hypothetical protein